jgi:hypothetical protein
MSLEEHGVIQLAVNDGASLMENFSGYVLHASDQDVDCNTCRTKRRVRKTYSIFHPPQYFIFNFKRFAVSGSEYVKLAGHIPFDSEINIGPLLSGFDEVAKHAFEGAGGVYDDDGATPILRYEACAFTEHVGESRSTGHHVAYALRQYGNKRRVMKFNDEIVSIASVDDVVGAHAQMLLYRAEQPEVITALRGRKLPAVNVIDLAASESEPEQHDRDDAHAAIITTPRQPQRQQPRIYPAETHREFPDNDDDDDGDDESGFQRKRPRPRKGTKSYAAFLDNQRAEKTKKQVRIMTD